MNDIAILQTKLEVIAQAFVQLITEIADILRDALWRANQLFARASPALARGRYRGKRKRAKALRRATRKVVRA